MDVKLVSEKDPTPAEMMTALQQAGYRMTTARRAVVAAVAGRKRPFSSAEVLEEVLGGDRSVGRATVFRTLDVLQDLGMLGRVENPEGGHGYVACQRGHHHHAICSGCGIVVDLPGCHLGAEVEEEARAAGFALTGHRLEYFGLCQACQTKGVD
jgi:Fur family transcriptional regulator, ferric uptake regulator